MAAGRLAVGARPAGTATGQAVVRSVLQGYADRGVFRGLHVTENRGRLSAEFVWLMGKPMRAIYDVRPGRLLFPSLMPGVDSKSQMVLALRRVVAERSTMAVPGHKRVDRRRASVEAKVSRGALSLGVTVRGANHEYAARRVFNLINDLFLLLHESYPGYLVERFGLSTE